MDWFDELKKFCEDVTSDIQARMDHVGDSDTESLVLLSTYNEKCKGILSEFDNDVKNSWKDFGVRVLKDIAQLILDVTYVKEVDIVDADFPEKTAEDDIKYILDSLSNLEKISKKLQPEEDVISCLGAEIVECVRWRKGALLYMLCHTLHHRPPGIKVHQVHYLEDGADYLVSMLNTRCDTTWLDSPEACDITKDGDTLQLIEQGIFSDTHLLALMYCGEMCYWFTTHPSLLSSSSLDKQKKGKTTSEVPNQEKHSTTDCDNQSTSNDKLKEEKSADCEKGGKVVETKDTTKRNNVDETLLRMCKIGNSCLKRYLSVVQGPLVSAGWSTERASDLISQMEALKL